MAGHMVSRVQGYEAYKARGSYDSGPEGVKMGVNIGYNTKIIYPSTARSNTALAPLGMLDPEDPRKVDVLPQVLAANNPATQLHLGAS